MGTHRRRQLRHRKRPACQPVRNIQPGHRAHAMPRDPRFQDVEDGFNVSHRVSGHPSSPNQSRPTQRASALAVDNNHSVTHAAMAAALAPGSHESIVSSAAGLRAGHFALASRPELARTAADIAPAARSPVHHVARPGQQAADHVRSMPSMPADSLPPQPRGTTIGTLRCGYSVLAACRGRVSADGVCGRLGAVHRRWLRISRKPPARWC